MNIVQILAIITYSSNSLNVLIVCVLSTDQKTPLALEKWAKTVTLTVTATHSLKLLSTNQTNGQK